MTIFKKLLLIALLSGYFINGKSQDEKYLLSNNKQLSWSLFIAPEAKYTRIYGIGTLYGGVKGAILYNNKYAIGLSVGSFLTEAVKDGPGSEGNITGLNQVMGYGGFYFDYFSSFNSPVQISFPIVIGGGGIILLEKKEPNSVGIVDEKFVEGGVFFALEPAINMELNISKAIRVGFGIGYRFIINSDLERYSNKDLSAPSVNMNVKFGIF